MQIRKAHKTDIPALSELAVIVSKKYITPSLTEPAISNLLNSLSANNFKDYLNQDYSYYLVEIDQKIIGMIGLKDANHLYHLFVDEHFQNKGYARQLWHIASENAVKLHHTKIFTVNSSINALSVYEKLGFIRHTDLQEKNGIPYITMNYTV